MDDFCTEKVFDHVCITVNMVWGNVGVFNEVEFPESVVSGDAGGFAKSRFRKSKFTRGLAFDVIFGATLPNQSGEFALAPVSVLTRRSISIGTFLRGSVCWVSSRISKVDRSRCWRPTLRCS